MVIGIGDTVTVTNTVGTDALDSDALGVMAFYARQQAERQEELDLAMLAHAGLAIAQMIYYWDKVDDYVEKRDCAIGEFVKTNEGMLGFLAELEDYRDQDWNILQSKANIKNQINFTEWEPDSCRSSTLYLTDSFQDSRTVHDFEKMFVDTSPEGIPEGWGIHDGSLAFGLGAAFSGPMINIAAVEMYESFKAAAVQIVQQAQMSMKAIYNISSIMKYYEQAIGIYEGFAGMYMQGFNSAGAMLGTSLGKLFSAAPGSGSTVSTQGISGSSSNVIPIGTTASAGVR